MKSTNLVKYGSNWGSTVGLRYTKHLRSLYVFASIPFEYLGIFIGIILSDGCLQLRKTTRLNFEQSLNHFPYFWFVFNLLSHFYQSYPNLYCYASKGSVRYILKRNSRAYPFLTTLYHLFYVDGVKVIPNCIYDLITPIALAHWIMGDGNWVGSGLRLCTDSFTIPEVVRLINVLMIRYRLDCTLQIHHGHPRIYIRARSITRLRSIVLPFMHSSMYYKLGL